MELSESSVVLGAACPWESKHANFASLPLPSVNHSDVSDDKRTIVNLCLKPKIFDFTLQSCETAMGACTTGNVSDSLSEWRQLVKWLVQEGLELFAHIGQPRLQGQV